MTDTAYELQKLADEVKHLVLNVMDSFYIDTDRHEQVNASIDALLSLAQASQARTDGGAVAEWVNEEQGFQALVPTAQIPDCTKLYTAPPGNATQAAGAREPLTREQAIRLWGNRSDGPSNGEIVAFARAIEAAHGIASPAAELKKD